MEDFHHIINGPTDIADNLVNCKGKDFRDKYGEYIERFGGLYNPGFTYDNIFEHDNNPGWSKFLGIIKQSPTKESTYNTIKTLKARKKVLDSIQNSKNKELLMANENVLKWYAYEQFFKNQK